MTAPETRRVIAALTRDGAVVRFCGGAVRDALIAREAAADIDLATPDPPETVMRLAAEAGLSTRIHVGSHRKCSPSFLVKAPGNNPASHKI